MSLNKLGTALSAVFLTSLVVLVAEVLYVLWRRRAFRRQSADVEGSDHLPASAPSKELLYFLCWKQQTRVEPDGGGGAAPASQQDGLVPETPVVEVIDVLKLQEMCGPSRVLFTIREEREDAESDRSLTVPSADKNYKAPMEANGVSLEECFSVPIESPAVTVNEDVETPPFSTPCSSPQYYTPAASPGRELKDGVFED